LLESDSFERDWAMEFGNALIIDGLRTLALDPAGASAAAVDDRAVGVRLLYDEGDSGEEHYLIRYPGGVRGRAHEHTASHTIVVLEGTLDANGQLIGPGSYAHFPARQAMRHQAAGDDGCLFVILFHGPFDVHIVDVELR
jgi:quercetin dioxygenase-like cupin family protein